MNNFDLAIHVVSKFTKVAASKIRSKDQHAPVVEARRYVVLLLKREGCIDLTTSWVLKYARNSILQLRQQGQAKLQNDPLFRDNFEKICEKYDYAKSIRTLED